MLAQPSSEFAEWHGACNWNKLHRRSLYLKLRTFQNPTKSSDKQAHDETSTMKMFHQRIATHLVLASVLKGNTATVFDLQVVGRELGP